MPWSSPGSVPRTYTKRALLSHKHTLPCGPTNIQELEAGLMAHARTPNTPNPVYEPVERGVTSAALLCCSKSWRSETTRARQSALPWRRRRCLVPCRDNPESARKKQPSIAMLTHLMLSELNHYLVYTCRCRFGVRKYLRYRVSGETSNFWWGGLQIFGRAWTKAQLQSKTRNLHYSRYNAWICLATWERKCSVGVITQRSWIVLQRTIWNAYTSMDTVHVLWVRSYAILELHTII